MITSNGNTDFTNLVPGREYEVWLEGNFNGATVAVQCSRGGTTFAPPTSDGTTLEFTASGGRIVSVPGKNLRLVTTNAGGSTSIDPSVFPVAS